MAAELNINQEQERYEIGTWLRLLDYQQQENIFVKNRIAEIAKRNMAKEMLDQLEHYQNLFLNKDALIVLLRRDIVQLSDGVTLDGNSKTDLATMRKDIQRMEQEFNALRAEFNSYMRSLD